jgi:S-methylmethionine-dependent homocysteine/selenocysteine methylase
MNKGSEILLLDGATGTELGRRGVDITLPLWSARALLDAPDVLAEIHREYLEAGAGAVTANTFRTHRRSLAKAGLGDQAPALTRRAVEIARAARDAHRPEALVLGSVAPLEDCYEPWLAPEAAACRAEHAEIVGHLLEAGADGILIETMNNLTEARAAADAESADDAGAVGVNCVAAPHVEAQVRYLRQALPDGVRIMAYANVGYADEAGNWVCTDAADPARFADYARRWVDAGATIVGGCCGTTPDTIRAVAEQLRN